MAASESTPSKLSAPSPVAGWLGLVVACGGMLVLVGWGWDIPLLKSALPGFVSMKANAALGFVLAGAALTPLAGDRQRRLRPLANACTLVMMLLGLLTAVEYAAHCDLGIDQLLFTEPPGALRTLSPGRMAPLSALEFFLLGVVFLLAEHPRTLGLAQRLALLIALFGMVPLCGQIYGSPLATGLGYYLQMAVHTALLFVIAGVAAFLLHPHAGVHHYLTPATMGRWVICRMLPIVVGVPLLLGWLHEMANRAGFHDAPLGDALLMLAIMLLQIIMLWWTAGTITRLDLKRQQTEADLRRALAQRQESDDQFMAIFHASQDAIHLIEDAGFTDCNVAALRMLGLTDKAQLRHRGPADFAPTCQPDGQPSSDKARAMMDLALRQGFHRFDWTARRSDGTLLNTKVSVTPMVIAGKPQLYCVVQDVTEQRQREDKLRQLSQVVEQTPAAVAITDTHGTIEYVNPAFTRLTGYPLAEALGQNPRVLQSGFTPRETYLNMWQELGAGRTWRGELCNKARNGTIFWELAVISPLRDQRGQTTHYVAVKEDITVSKMLDQELHASQRKLAQAVELAHLLPWEYDVSARELVFDERVYALYGDATARAGQGRIPLEEYLRRFVHPEDAPGVAQRMQHVLSSTGAQLECQSEHRLIRGDGAIRNLLVRYSVVRGADGKVTGLQGVSQDITAQKTMEAQLRAAASVDKLTGLTNRALLCDRLQQTILRAQRRKDYHFAVLFLDMDRFKLINDSLGHDVGDLMLQEIGRRLNAAIRIGDSLGRPDHGHTTARLGGDEFVILLDTLQHPGDATRVAARMLEVLAEPYRLHEHDIYSTASIGIVTSDMAAESAEQILRDADTAMYEAKLAGKGRYAVFGAPMRQRVQERLNIETDLRKAINTDQFFVVYEPIVSLITGEIERFEALLRWQHPQRGLVMPGEFIPIAEETGLILPLGEWVLRTACRQFAQWRAQLGPGAPRGISVNLSRTQLLLRDLPQRVQTILRDSGIPAAGLHLEVTESAVMRDAAGAARTLHAIRALGVKLDMDDFGTGYSSLACLHEFPLDVLKIDRSFIANIERGRDFAALVHAVTQLARNLNIQVVAEGIETADQAAILQAHDCEFGQGYYFSRPMDPQAAAQFRADARGWNAQRSAIGAPAALNASAP